LSLFFSQGCIIVSYILTTKIAFLKKSEVILIENINLFLPEEVMMKLNKYLESTKGVGVLATADGDGKVDAAIYARPHFMEDGTLAVIMRDRLTHHNLQSNSHATFLFIEGGPGYKGKRLFMTKVREEEETELLYSLRRRQYPNDKEEAKFLVFFKLDKELPLVGAGG
jgi:hypothetical protein